MIMILRDNDDVIANIRKIKGAHSHVYHNLIIYLGRKHSRQRKVRCRTFTLVLFFHFFDTEILKFEFNFIPIESKFTTRIIIYYFTIDGKRMGNGASFSVCVFNGVGGRGSGSLHPINQ